MLQGSKVKKINSHYKYLKHDYSVQEEGQNFKTGDS